MFKLTGPLCLKKHIWESTFFSLPLLKASFKFFIGQFIISEIFSSLFQKIVKFQLQAPFLFFSIAKLLEVCGCINDFDNSYDSFTWLILLLFYLYINSWTDWPLFFKKNIREATFFSSIAKSFIQFFMGKFHNFLNL